VSCAAHSPCSFAHDECGFAFVRHEAGLILRYERQRKTPDEKLTCQSVSASVEFSATQGAQDAPARKTPYHLCGYARDRQARCRLAPACEAESFVVGFCGGRLMGRYLHFTPSIASQCSACGREFTAGDLLVGKDLPRAYQFTANGKLIIRSARPDEHWSVMWEHY